MQRGADRSFAVGISNSKQTPPSTLKDGECRKNLLSGSPVLDLPLVSAQRSLGAGSTQSSVPWSNGDISL